MTSPARFLFDDDFAAPPVAAAPEPPPPPGPSLAEHLAAVAAAEARGRATGYEEGRIAGQADAAARASERLAAEASRLAAAAQALLASVDADRCRIERSAADLALAAARKLAGKLVEREPLTAIVALIEDCLVPLRQAPHLVVRLAADDASALGPAVDRLAHEKGFPGRIVILGEPDLARGDCRIEWADGGMVVERASIDALITAAVDRFFAARAVSEEAPT